MANSETRRLGFVFDSSSVGKLARKLKNDEFIKQNAQFTYFYSNVQSDLAERLSKHSKLKSVSKLEDKVIILRRMDEKYSEFGWLDVEVPPLNDEMSEKLDWSQFIEDVKANLRLVMGGEKRLKFKTPIPIFYSESQQVI